jgi:hypothetical protein
MLPHHKFHSHLCTLANTSYALILHPDTPECLRRSLCKLYRKLKKEMPPEAIRKIEAAEAKATIGAADHLRRFVPDS